MCRNPCTVWGIPKRPRASWSVRLRLQTLSVQFSCSRICTRRLQVAARWEAAANFRTVWRWEARKSRNPVPFVARHNVAEGSKFCAFSRTLWRILAKGRSGASACVCKPYQFSSFSCSRICMLKRWVQIISHFPAMPELRTLRASEEGTLTGGSTLCLAARGSEKTCKITDLWPK